MFDYYKQTLKYSYPILSYPIYHDMKNSRGISRYFQFSNRWQVRYKKVVTLGEWCPVRAP